MEEQGIMFQRNTILPWVKRWEAEFNRKLFITDSEYYIRFNMDGLLRGDIRSRYEAYTKSRQWGFQSVNEIRKMENMPPIENGDIYLQPMNMVSANSTQDSESNDIENE
mgnify:FL=1